MGDAGDREGQAPRLTVSGYRRGRYVVIEERDDGTLLIAPDPADEVAVSSGRPSRRSIGVLGAALFKSRDQRSVEELVSDWGVNLRREERITEFQMVEVGGEPTFAALTTERLILSASGNLGAQVHELSECTAVDLAGGRHRRLRIRWSDNSETVIASHDDAVSKLHRALQRS